MVSKVSLNNDWLTNVLKVPINQTLLLLQLKKYAISL